MGSAQSPNSTLTGAAAARRPLPIETRRHAVVTEVARRLAESCGMDGGGPLVVGASGGADSTALLLAATVLRDRDADAAAGAVTPVAVHVHHHLRGDEADEDAQYLESLCARLGIELHVAHIQPGDLPGNLAHNARRLRYDALARVASAQGAGHVAVAHHADDQLETILMALLRGAGLDGLSGMAWMRSLEDSVTLVRPLLAVSADDCRDLCRTAGVEWREDSANADIRSARARLRREVIPVLETLWPGAAGRATAAADLVGLARRALEREVEAAFGSPAIRRWPRSTLSSHAPAFIATGLRRAAVAASPAHADAIGHRLLETPAKIIASDDRRPRRYDWPGGLLLEITSREVVLHHADDATENP